MIKPCAVSSNKEELIINDIKSSGFEIISMRKITLNKEDARWLYKEHKNKDHYNDLVNFTISGPVIILIIATEQINTHSKFRELMGPTDIEKADKNTLRAKYAENFRRNAIHGSDSLISAYEEIEYFNKYF